MKIKKRELAAYVILSRKPEWELSDAIIEISLSLCTTKRTARRIIKRLRRSGLIKEEIKTDKIMLKPKSPEDAFKTLVSGYIANRKIRCAKKKGENQLLPK